MGYYTHYTLKWKPIGKLPQRSCRHTNPPGAKFCSECGKEISEVMGPEEYIKANDEMSYALVPNGESSGEGSKWYDHEKDMREMSIALPQYHFTLHGEGEETGDLWQKHFINGKMQECRAEIIYPEFDKDKLL